jgi:hypothetical protein
VDTPTRRATIGYRPTNAKNGLTPAFRTSGDDQVFEYESGHKKPENCSCEEEGKKILGYFDSLGSRSHDYKHGKNKRSPKLRDE